MAVVSNPILPGFHPDPCICRVDDTYYLATSTFEWWPAVRIHRSRDLATWEIAGHAITRRSQLELRGTPDSGGAWAPSLTHANGKFWLIYSDVKSFNGPFKDLRNYLITAEQIEGPWSDPVALNASGFDASLFHDTDGRKWLLNQIWRPVPGLAAFAGIALQEYSMIEQRLVGEAVTIFLGTDLCVTEGPQLLRKDGYYYLITAEGGTGWTHAVTVARSRSITGPYEVSPDNPLLTSRYNPENPLQKAGHGSLVETPDGRWFMAHLCSRPVGPKRRCILGRETALQAITWPAGGWPRLMHGGREPALTVDVPGVNSAQPYMPSFEDNFDGLTLALAWNTLRESPVPAWLSLTERPGWLRLRGRHSLQSKFDQSLVGFRLLHHRCRVTTCLDFSPRNFHQSAGLAMFYNTANFYYAFVSATESGMRELQILACDNRTFREVMSARLALPPGPIELGARLDGESLQFFLMTGGAEQPLGPVLDATTLSDDYPVEGNVGWAFTGAFAVLCAQDSADSGVPADFDWFRYTSEF